MYEISNAMLKGSLVVDFQIGGDYVHDGTKGLGACALGCVALGCRNDIITTNEVAANVIGHHFFEILLNKAEHPILGYTDKIWDIIIELNDNNGWSIYEIANWLHDLGY